MFLPQTSEMTQVNFRCTTLLLYNSWFLHKKWQFHCTYKTLSLACFQHQFILLLVVSPQNLLFQLLSLFLFFSLGLSGMVKKVNFKEVFVVLIFVGEIKFHVFKLMVIQPTHIKRTDEWKSIFIELIQYFCTTVYSSNGYGGIALQICTKAVL